MGVHLHIQKSLRELVYLELKHKILTGEIPAQTRLMEMDLAEKMNVSRTPIRDAIKALEEEGLVTIEPRRGAYVSRISVKDLLDVFEVREDLEGFAASLAAQRITEEGKLSLAKLTRLYERAIEKNDKSRIVEYDEKIHNFIVECSGNSVLTQLVHQVQDLSLRFRYLYYDDFGVYEKMPEEHHRIMEAVCSGNAEEARAAADQHVKTLKECIMNLDKTMGRR
ncbi:MAG: GntR family transcriptional regulator [Mogibacterium sp.]|nr:GntR family transcriptional regulator [Mogibacterium sp.]